jgi:hypothetical protein
VLARWQSDDLVSPSGTRRYGRSRSVAERLQASGIGSPCRGRELDARMSRQSCHEGLAIVVDAVIAVSVCAVSAVAT